jgi:hypothetical protein
VPRHVVAAEEAEEPASAERKPRASGLAGDEKRCARRGEREQPGKTRVIEVMQK